MTANLILIGATALIGLVGFLGLWMKSRQDMATGAQLEAGKVNAASLAAETAIANAVVNAPRTDAAVDDRLSRGDF